LYFFFKFISIKDDKAHALNVNILCSTKYEV